MPAEPAAGSGHNAVTRDPSFGVEFVDQFQDKLMFGTDSCSRLNDVADSPNSEETDLSWNVTRVPRRY